MILINTEEKKLKMYEAINEAVREFVITNWEKLPKDETSKEEWYTMLNQAVVHAANIYNCLSARFVEIYKLSEDVKTPVYSTDGAACFDIHAHLPPEQKIYIYPGGAEVISTGLIFKIPRGFCMKIYSRSGMGFNDNISLINSVGIIDSDYRGEVKVKLIKALNGSDTDYAPYCIQNGDRIAQAMIVPVTRVLFSELKEKPELEGNRKGGYGSTGN
jgi:dUTP pyrophosphatase